MNKGNRKRILPLAVMSMAVVGMLAAFIALAAAQPQPAAAQGDPLCDGPLAPLLPQCQDDPTPTPTSPPPVDPGNGNGNGNGDTGTTSGDMIASSSTSGGAGVELILTIKSLSMDAVAGSSVELYLEDDFQIPDSIARDTVYFTVPGGGNDQNGGGRVYTADPVEIDDSDHFTENKDDYSIRVFIPDMNNAENSGYNGPTMGQTVNLVFTKAAGIKNPTEAGTHSVGYSVLDANDEANDGPMYSRSLATPCRPSTTT